MISKNNKGIEIHEHFGFPIVHLPCISLSVKSSERTLYIHVQIDVRVLQFQRLTVFKPTHFIFYSASLFSGAIASYFSIEVELRS